VTQFQKWVTYFLLLEKLTGMNLTNSDEQVPEKYLKWLTEKQSNNWTLLEHKSPHLKKKAD